MLIFGNPTKSLKGLQDASRVVSGGTATEVFINDTIPSLWVASVSHGVDPTVVVAQAAHETSWGNYGGAVRPLFFNTCGLKIRNNNEFDCAKGDMPLAHAQFAGWDAGATAHVQHLLAYCNVELNRGEILLDPRWIWVKGKHNVTTVEELGGKWAPSSTYGIRVATLASRLQTA